MNATTTDIWGYQATVGAAARSRWSATAAFGLHHRLDAIAMPSKAVSPSIVTAKPNGIRHRPSGGST